MKAFIKIKYFVQIKDTKKVTGIQIFLKLTFENPINPVMFPSASIPMP